jgi:hypothetical protein
MIVTLISITTGTYKQNMELSFYLSIVQKRKLLFKIPIHVQALVILTTILTYLKNRVQTFVRAWD